MPSLLSCANIIGNIILLLRGEVKANSPFLTYDDRILAKRIIRENDFRQSDEGAINLLDGEIWIYRKRPALFSRAGQFVALLLPHTLCILLIDHIADAGEEHDYALNAVRLNEVLSPVVGVLDDDIGGEERLHVVVRLPG